MTPLQVAVTKPPEGIDVGATVNVVAEIGNFHAPRPWVTTVIASEATLMSITCTAGRLVPTTVHIVPLSMVPYTPKSVAASRLALPYTTRLTAPTVGRLPVMFVHTEPFHCATCGFDRLKRFVTLTAKLAVSSFTLVGLTDSPVT